MVTDPIPRVRAAASCRPPGQWWIDAATALAEDVERLRTMAETERRPAPPLLTEQCPACGKALATEVSEGRYSVDDMIVVRDSAAFHSSCADRMDREARGEEDGPILTIDPARQAGAVCLPGTRLPAETIAGIVASGDSVEAVAREYNISRMQVLLCCWWYANEQATYRTRQAKRVTAAWGSRYHEGSWAETALKVLGGWKDGPLPDPPPITTS